MIIFFRQVGHSRDGRHGPSGSLIERSLKLEDNCRPIAVRIRGILEPSRSGGVAPRSRHFLRLLVRGTRKPELLDLRCFESPFGRQLCQGRSPDTGEKTRKPEAATPRLQVVSKFHVFCFSNETTLKGGGFKSRIGKNAFGDYSVVFRRSRKSNSSPAFPESVRVCHS